MVPNSHMYLQVARLRQAELAAQARHADLIRRARAGQLQAELRAGRVHERESRLAALLRRRPATT
jgi:hypothetical protein